MVGAHRAARAARSGPPSRRVAHAARADAPWLPLDDVRLRAPLVPPVILNSGQNYWDHRDEKPEVDQKEPEFFLKTPLARDRPGRARAVRLDRDPQARLRGRARRGDRQARPAHPASSARSSTSSATRSRTTSRRATARPSRTRRAASSTRSGRARTSTRPRRSGRGSSRATRSPTRRTSACGRTSTTRSARTTRPRR